VPEASKLSGVRSQRIRRWLSGYEYSHGDKRLESKPVWTGQIEPLESRMALGFLDLMEIRFVSAFIEQGVSLQAIRKAAQRARQVFGVDHPFCAGKFLTDGRTVFIEVGEELRERELLDLVKNQFAFKKVLKPYTIGLDYENDVLARWWPMGKNRRVVIDPERSFGTPIVSKRGIPTDILHTALLREGSVSEVMKWFDVSRQEVLDAKRFEERVPA